VSTGEGYANTDELGLNDGSADMAMDLGYLWAKLGFFNNRSGLFDNGGVPLSATLGSTDLRICRNVKCR